MSESSSNTSSPDVPHRVGAVIVAGGSGLRMRGAGGGPRKQYALLLGEPVLAWSIRAFTQHPGVTQVAVVLPPDDLSSPPDWLERFAPALVGGGTLRSDSVRHGLEALDPRTDLVLVHDGARPFVNGVLLDRLIEAAAGGPVIPGQPATDTLKETDEHGFVRRTLDRARVWHAQTPQAFPFALLREAHRRAETERWTVTDDAALCERLGVPVRVIEGDPDNIKITIPRDLEVARAIAEERRGRTAPASLPTHESES